MPPRPETQCQCILRATPVDPVVVTIRLVMTTVHIARDAAKEKFPRTSWAELLRIDPGYAKRAMAIATALGYCTSDPAGCVPDPERC